MLLEFEIISSGMGVSSIFGDTENLDWSKNLNILQGTIFHCQKDGQNDLISIFFISNSWMCSELLPREAHPLSCSSYLL